jgi:uroporphyrinogen decarboxylase
MRQAGRYLPAYRAIRNKYSFLKMVHTPDLAAEITLLPIKTFEMDAAILFSDILVVAEAFGVGLQFKDSLGPIMEKPIQNISQVEALAPIEAEDKFGDIAEAIRLILPQLKVPLIGFCGGPFTVASYMIEGNSSRDLLKTKRWMMKDPLSFHSLLSHITRCSIDYLKLQIKAGVQAIQIFDSWANALGYYQFKEFCLDYLKQIVQELQETKIPIILFCRGSSVFAKELASIGPQALSIDWNGNLSHIRSYISPQIALQGNLDPDILYAPLTTVKYETERLLHSMRGNPGYIFNLGHGIKPDVSPDAVKTLVEAVKNF